MADVTLKQGDTTPEFSAALDGATEDLEGDESIRFYMEHQDTGDLIVNQPVSSVDYAADPPTVTYDFDAGETSRSGVHLAEVVVTYSDGEIQSFPADGYYQISITQPTNREVAPADLDAPDITVGVVSADALAGSLTGGEQVDTIDGDGLEIVDNALTITGTTGGGGGSSGANTVRSGSGAPASDTGAVGDFYIDTGAEEVYGPKTSGGWGSSTSLVGPQGPEGPEGLQGPEGPQGPPGEDGTDATAAFSLAASGSASLDGNESVVVDTGVAVDDGYYDPVPGEWPTEMDLALSIESDESGTGNYLIHVEQNTSSVTSGNVGWQLLRSEKLDSEATTDPQDARVDTLHANQVGAANDPVGESYTEELSVGETGPVTGIVGDSDEYEYLGPIVIGDPTATNVDTMSTAYTQPYNSSYRMVMPNTSIADVTGTEGLYLSLTGRFNVVDNSSGSVVSIRAYDISNNTPIAATETDSSAGAGFERFHTERGAMVTDTDQLFLGYEIKTSDTQAGLFGPILGHYWRLIA